jgi:hypothetical protein
LLTGRLNVRCIPHRHLNESTPFLFNAAVVGDGNGRMDRFLMNVTMASGGYPWTVIRMRDRKAYLAALDNASIGIDIAPFKELIAQRVRWSLERHELKFPDRAEKWGFDREVINLLRTGWGQSRAVRHQQGSAGR